MEPKYRRYHVSGKCLEKKWPNLTQKQAWNQFTSVLSCIHQCDVITHAFVLMNNHYHWICSLKEGDNNVIFPFFHSLAEYYLGSVFEDFPHIEKLNSREAYKNSYYYVYRNPIAAGLCERAEDYPYSTLGAMLGQRRPSFACVDNMNLIVNPTKVLGWINANYH